MDEDQIKYMVDRFLGWKLPKNFAPDAGISYSPPSYAATNPPSGTNLLTAEGPDERWVWKDLARKAYRAPTG